MNDKIKITSLSNGAILVMERFVDEAQAGRVVGRGEFWHHLEKILNAGVVVVDKEIALEITAYSQENDRRAAVYTLSTRDDPTFPYWLENECGEGMSLSENNLFGMLDEYYKKNF